MIWHRFWPLLALLLGLAVLGAALVGDGFARANSFAEAGRLQAHTLEVIAKAERTRSAVRNVQRGQRGYLLTGDPAHLEPYHRGRAEVQQLLTGLRRLTRDNPVQVVNVGQLQVSVDLLAQEMQRTIAAKQAGRTGEALALVRQGAGERLIETVDARVSSIVDEEQRLLAGRRASTDAAERALFRNRIALGALSSLLLAAAAWAAVAAARARGAQALEKSRADASAKEAEADMRLARLLDQAGDGFAALDREYRILFVNAAAVRMDGRSAGAMVGRTHWEVWPADVGTPIEEAFRRCMEERTPVELDHCYVDAAAGRDIWLGIRAYPTDEGIGVFYRDITEAKKADTQVRFLADLSAALSDAPDPNGILEVAARTLGEQLGAGRVGFAEIDEAREWATVSISWTDGTLPQAHGRWRTRDFGPELFEALARGETTHFSDVSADLRTAEVAGRGGYEQAANKASINVPLLRDGCLRGLLFVDHARPHVWTADEIALSEAVAERTGFALERARAEAALRSSEGRFRAVFENTALGIARVAFDGERFLEVNDALCAITGYGRDELVGRSWVSITHPDDVDADLLPFQRMAAGEVDSYDVEKRYIRKDGAHVWVKLTLSLVRRADGQPDFEICVVEDIAERRAAAAARAAEAKVLAAAVDTDVPLEQLLNQLIYAVEEASADGALGSVLLLDADSGRLHHGSAPSLPEAYNAAVDGIAVGEGVGSCGTAVHRRMSVVSADLASDPLWADYRDLALTHGLRACWSTPILSAAGTLLGTFAIYHREPRRPSAADMILVEHTARTAALVIERKRGEAERRSSDGRRTFLLELADRLRDDPRATLVTSEALGRVLSVSRAGYAIADASGRNLFVEHEWADGTVRQATGQHRLDDFGPWVANELRAGRTIVVNDVLADEHTAGGSAAYLATATRAVVTVPVIRGDRLVATVYLNHYTPRVWTDEEVRLVEDVAERTWAAVERERAELALRESEARFRTVAEALPSLVFVTDADGSNTYTNSTFQRITGLSAKALLGTGWLQVIHPDDVEHTNAAWSEAVRTETAYEIEYRFRLADGSFRWHLGRGLPLRNAAGAIDGWFGSVTDIQDIVDARETLARTNLELEALVAERTEEVTQLQKMEAIGQLTGGVAHDFNNLLTPIVGGLDLLRRKLAGDERSERLLNGALQSAERARMLVSRLLAFARRQHLQARPVDVPALIAGMRDLVDRSLGPTIEVDVQTPPGLPPARVDPNQLELSLLNLSVNARDAMPGGGRLTISATVEQVAAGHPSRLPAGEYLRLAVADTGTGMDAETLRRCVEPFYSTKGIGKGTGLGLSMVHGLAAQSGGVLTLDSTPGAGTTAMLWLPVATEGLASAGPPANAAEPVPAEHVATILLVDDEEAVRLSTAEMLTELGYAVTEAASADDALHLLAGGLVPDALVTDYVMPGRNGAELAAAIRAQLPGLPVLVMTGYSHLDEVDNSLARLEKPFRHADLAARVRELLEGASNIVRLPPRRTKGVA